MKKKLLALAIGSMLLVPAVAGAEGFGIVEWSAEGTAMGGARMFADNDPAMIAYNPAHLVSIDKKAAAFHVTQISPHGKFDAQNNGIGALPPGIPQNHASNRISPGMVPGLYYAQKIDDKSAWGIGTFTRYGMICELEQHSLFARSSYKAKMTGLSITPVYARKLNKKLTASVGGELNYVDLNLKKNLLGGTPGYSESGNGEMDIKGDTWAAGWNASLEYNFDDKNQVGLVYRSKISQNMKNGDVAIPNLPAKFGPLAGHSVNFDAKVILPDTWTIGYGHKFNDKTRVEIQAMRTNWHTYESLDMNLAGGVSISDPKNWKDGWRYAIGLEHKFSEKYTGYLGYSYDEAGIPETYADFMIPTGNRRTYSIGASYKDKKQMLTGALGYMRLGDKNMGATKELGFDSRSTHNYAKIWSIGYTRFF